MIGVMGCAQCGELATELLDAEEKIVMRGYEVEVLRKKIKSLESDLARARRRSAEHLAHLRSAGVQLRRRT